MKRYALLLASYCLLQNLTASDFDWNKTTRTAYTEIRELRLTSGRELLKKEVTNSGIKLYLENYADIVYLLVTEDPAYFKQAQNREDERLDAVEKLDKNSPYYRFVQAEIRLHWAFVKLKFGKELSGCWDIIKAYRLLDENHQKFPTFLPNQKSLGLLHVLIGATPDSYQWVPNLLGLRGNINQGLQEIQTVAKQDSVFRPEAQLIDYLLNSYVIGMTDKKILDLEQTIRQQPDDLLFHLFGASMFIKNNQSERALKVLLSRPSGTDYLVVPSLEYLKGEALLEKGQYPKAIEAYKAYLRLQKGHNFLKDANYKIFLAYFLQGKETEGKVHLENVLKLGKTITEPDKAAQRFAEEYQKGWKPIPQLMKARLAFDGGYYNQALSYLQANKESDFPQPKDKAEYTYRLGRILQKMNELDQSTPLYERTIVLSNQTDWSFGATASLQLGYIYLAKNQPQKAKQYFQKALSYHKHEYKTSVDNKARAALNKMGN